MRSAISVNCSNGNSVGTQGRWSRAAGSGRPASTAGSLVLGSGLLLLVKNALMQVADDHVGQTLVVHEEPLADRVGILLGDLDRLLERILGGEAAVDKPFYAPDPILDDLALLFQIGLGARIAVPRHDRLDIERFDALPCR